VDGKRGGSASDIFEVGETVAPSGELVGHWNFNEGSGVSAEDFSGYGNHGDLNGGLLWTAGSDGNAIEFHSDHNEHVNISDNSDFNFERTDAFTVEAVIFTEAIGSAVHEMIVTNVGSNGEGWMIGYYNDKLFFQMRGNYYATPRQGIAVNSMESVTDFESDWYTIKITYDGSSTAEGLKMYIDDIPQTINTIRNNLTDHTTMHDGTVQIGRYPTDYYLTGKLDDLKIYQGVQ